MARADGVGGTCYVRAGRNAEPRREKRGSLEGKSKLAQSGWGAALGKERLGIITPEDRVVGWCRQVNKVGKAPLKE